MASFTETFTQANGALANGWSDDSDLGGTDPMVQVISNRGSTSSSTSEHVAHKLHGLTVSGDWQIDFDCFAPLIIGDGGINVWLVSNSTFQGWGVFVGNAVHIQKIAVGGGQTNLTNDGRPNEGTPGNQQNHITMTHRGSDGFMEVFVDGVSWNSTTDNSQSAGNMVFLDLQDLNSPTTECWIDNLVVQDFIGSVTAPAQVTGLSIQDKPGRATLSWTAPSNGGSAITDYLIERAPDVSGSPGTYTTVTDGTSTATTYTDTGLTNGSTYWYRVSAINAIGTGTASTAVSVTPTAHPWPEAIREEHGTSLGSNNAQVLPAGAASGDLVLYFVSNDNTSTTAITASAGWTAITNGAQTEGSNAHKSNVFARVLDGTTGSNILSVSGAAQDYTCIGVLIKASDHVVVQGSENSLIQCTGITNTSSVQIDPPNENAGVSDDYLWLAWGCIDAQATGDNITAPPTNYTMLQVSKSASSTSSSVAALAYRRLTASAESPGTFTNTSRPVIGLTVAIPPAGGPVTLNRTMSDTAAATDAMAKGSTYVRSFGDTAAATDASTRIVLRVRTFGDTAVATDAITRGPMLMIRSMSDTAPATDTMSKSTTRTRTMTDTAAATEAMSRTVVRNRTISDAAPTADAMVKSLTTQNRIIGDSAPTTDALTRSISLTRTFSDSAPATDANTVSFARTRSLSDSASATEVFTRGVVLMGRTCSDSAPASESATRSRLSTRTGVDSAPATDAITRTGTTRSRALGDAAGATDTLTRGLNANARSTSDSAPATDGMSTGGPQFRTMGDSAPTTDSITRTSSGSRSFSDSAPATDVSTRLVARARTVTDSAPATDSASRSALVMGRALADTAQASDVISKFTLRNRSFGDSAPVTDGMTIALARFRTLTDTAPLSDTVARGPLVMVRFIADDVPATDAIFQDHGDLPKRLDLSETGVRTSGLVAGVQGSDLAAGVQSSTMEAGVRL